MSVSRFPGRPFAASLVTMAVAVAIAAAPARADVGVSIDGTAIALSPPPIVQAGRVFVPLRGIFERLGASVVYANGTINATGNGRDVSLRIGSSQATVDGEPETIDVAPFIVGASTFVPLRFVSEALGASVNYDDADDDVSITTVAGEPYQSAANDASDAAPPAYSYASEAPPPLPSYAQPEVPAPNEIWQPGFWAFGPYGYYWVPGTWVEPPQPGYLWTPGYWHAAGPRYAFVPGFWAVAVGFYGGIDYGHGYAGTGYDGGRWFGNEFRYNSYVTNVNTTIVRNVYVDKTVVVNNDVTRISYNGGAHGIVAQPTARELEVAHQTHLPRTQAQIQHVRIASQDRRLLVSVNHAQPPVSAVARPLTVEHRPEGFTPVRDVDRPRARLVAPAPPRPVAAPRANLQPGNVEPRDEFGRRAGAAPPGVVPQHPAAISRQAGAPHPAVRVQKPPHRTHTEHAGHVENGDRHP